MGSLAFDRLKLAGFKSFVDATDFQIESGLTGVVGPNGCGKSNLLEAIRWVMGANSAKAMRGAAMDDVIFNGTKSRPGRNQAAVTLTIDNRARLAPPMFNDDDTLEVSRTITKGGGSKYRVNGKTVRAKDVQLLFADASTGANSPALVRQGQINELISAKPENRRRILEEAAGISGLHTRRHEAELRLRAAETNLSRLDDVLQQIESQLLSLRRQSRQATRYKRLAGEIREYKCLLWLKRWELAIATLQTAETDLSERNEAVTTTASLSTRLATEVAELATGLEPKREEQIVAAAVFGRLNAAKDALAQDEENAKGTIRELEARLEQITADLEREQSMVRDAQEAEARLGQEFEALSATQDKSGAIEAAQHRAAQAIAARQTVEADVSTLNRKLAEVSAHKAGAERELAQIAQRRERLNTEKAQALRGLQALDNRSGSANSSNLFEASVSDTAAALASARDIEIARASEKQNAETAERTARETLSETQQALGVIEAEIRALSNMLAKSDGDARWTPALDALDVEAGFETALAAALGDDLDASLEGESPLRWTQAVPPDQALPQGATPLSDHVRAPEALAARLSQIGVVDSDDIAILSRDLRPGQRLVTRGGDLYRWDGFVAEGDAPSTAARRLEQQNRLAELEARKPQHQEAVHAAEQRWQTARQTREQAEQAARQARQALPDLERAERAAQAALASFQTDIARETAERDALTDRVTRAEAELKELATRLSEAQTRVDAAEGVETLETELSEAQSALETARDAADEASAEYRSLKNEVETRAARLTAVNQERTQWASRSEQALTRISTLEQRKAATDAHYMRATSGPDQFAERREKLFSELAQAESRRASAQDALSQLETALKEAETRAREADQAHNSAREARAGAEARLVAAQERHAETDARIQELLSVEPAQLKSQLEELSPDSKLEENDIERKIDRLQQERERLGNVNLRADEEAVEEEEKLAAMNEERQDLIAAIARLREGIDELNSEGRERLLKAFDIVNGHFGRLFTTLFGGGSASLALTESDDPLEAGLDVLVSPPGKKLGSMSLMSGGEQALTATALIFAVFLSNPAPICVLDEVDAPLDDANVERYCNLLDAMTRETSTKFLAITHNAVTMSRMDRLYGVTMAEKGVSQLLSVDLGSAERLTAAE